MKYSLIAAMLIMMTAVSCDKDDDPQTVFTLSGDASGAQEVPPVSTTATGTLTGSYNSQTNTISYTITWAGLTDDPAAAHFHGPAAAGVSAGPVLTIALPTGAGTSGTVTGTGMLSEAQEADLLGGRWYYNIHTPTYPDGEIRGQVSAQ